MRGLASFPATWAAAAIATATGVAANAADNSPGFSPWLAAALVASAIGWCAIAARSKAYARHRARRHVARSASGSDTAATLRTDLAAHAMEQPLAQLGLLESKMAAVRKVLTRRLDAGEITFDRYLSAAEQAYLAGLDNLREIDVSATARQAIDPSYVERRLDALSDTSETEGARERDALNERMHHHRRLDTRIVERLTLNEEILSALDATASAMAHADIGARESRTSADMAIAELDRLARRVDAYARSTAPP